MSKPDYKKRILLDNGTIVHLTPHHRSWSGWWASVRVKGKYTPIAKYTGCPHADYVEGSGIITYKVKHCPECNEQNRSL